MSIQLAARAGLLERLDRSRYPLAVAVAVPLAAATTWRLGLVWELPAFLVLAVALVILSFIDLDTKTLPRPLVWFAALAGFCLLTPAALLSDHPERILTGALGASAVLVFLWVLHAASPGGLGFGDVRLGAVLGGYLGWLGLAHAAAALVLGFLLASATGILLIATRQAGRKSKLPFGPFLAGGAVAVILAPSLVGAILP